MFDKFELSSAKVNGVKINFRMKKNHNASENAILFLHGFPQTHVMWAGIADNFPENYPIICPDLRGYGDSEKPTGIENFSFRNMAKDQFQLMSQLGFEFFHIVGHDRGGRVAHRMALDETDRIKTITLMDIVPTEFLLSELTTPVAQSYYHWFFLAQQSPFPEKLISADPDYFYESCLLGWGAANLENFDPEKLGKYRKSWHNLDTIRAMCDDYRAAILFDWAVDKEDQNRCLETPACVMWGKTGAMAQNFDVPATWSKSFSNIEKKPMDGGHFFPDQYPQETADALASFIINNVD